MDTDLIKRNINTALQKVTQIDKSISRSLDKADKLKTKALEEHSAGWSWGGKDKRVAIEALQEVTRDMADSQIEIINTLKELYDGQKAIAQQMRMLFQIGAMSIAANRMVHRELKMRLQNASQEELSEMAREELMATVRQLEQMQDTLNIQERQKEKLFEQDRLIRSLQQEIKDCQNYLMSLLESDTTQDNILKVHEDGINTLSKYLSGIVSDIEILQKESDNLREENQQLKSNLNEVSKPIPNKLILILSMTGICAILGAISFFINIIGV